MRCITLTGPSGVGKTAIAKALVERYHFNYPRSAVTRPRRSGEDNVEYEFLTVDEWWDWHGQDRFCEWTNYRGHMYGMMRESFDKYDRLVAVLDRNGTRQIQEEYGAAVTSFLVLPPNVNALYERLRGRGDDEASILERLKDVYEEMRVTSQFDHIIVNRYLNPAVIDVMRVVWEEWT